MTSQRPTVIRSLLVPSGVQKLDKSCGLIQRHIWTVVRTTCHSIKIWRRIAGLADAQQAIRPMGHFQGLGELWGAPETPANNPVSGYLGTIATSASTLLRCAVLAVLHVPKVLFSRLARVAFAIRSVYPSFQLSGWFTDIGIAATNLFQDEEGFQSAASVLTVSGALKSTWENMWYFNTYSNSTSVGNKPFAGPMLVLHDTNDAVVDFDHLGTNDVVNQTCQAFPESQLVFARLDGNSHIGTPYLDNSFGRSGLLIVSTVCRCLIVARIRCMSLQGLWVLISRSWDIS